MHGDFHLRNVITSHDSGEVTAVLDWELSTPGDPSADMGTLLAYWPAKGEETPGDLAATALDGFPPREELVAAYSAASGRDLTALGYSHAMGPVEGRDHRGGRHAPCDGRTAEQGRVRDPDRRAHRRTGGEGPRSRRHAGV
ncbi:phosphotransferase [Streptomyces sp. NPDC001388]|uniref:phosphotransferase n=1 Tax=Streptomyces sp. NPDC001388 TaxID=3364568 RepID=UPI00367D592B